MKIPHGCFGDKVIQRQWREERLNFFSFFFGEEGGFNPFHANAFFSGWHLHKMNCLLRHS